MGILDLYSAYNIKIADEDERHHRDGWANVPCPHCTGNPGYHLGFNLDEGYYHCHRCGGHSIDYILSRLLNVSQDQAKQIAKDYGVLKRTSNQTQSNKAIKIGTKKFEFPSDTTELEPQHLRYLKKRNYDPVYLQREYGLLGTGPGSALYDKTTEKSISYKFRILAPIYWEGKLVSFQTRDYTDKQKLKYLTCPEEREIIFHKDILYRAPEPDDGPVGVCVEGITDVWRLGNAAFATFGTAYTPQQVRVMAKLFKKIFVIFDPESQAQRNAHRLVGRLKFRGVEAENILLPSDPGDLSPEEAVDLMKRLSVV